MATANPRANSRTTPLAIGMILGFGLVVLFWLGLRGDEAAVVEPHPWRVLTVNNSAVVRSNLPIKVICSLPTNTNDVSDQAADCYLRVSMQYNPEEETTQAQDCQLSAGFVSLVVGVGDGAKAIDSQLVDLTGEDGSCDSAPGVVIDALFWFESVPSTEKLSLIRFTNIRPQLELIDGLNFVVSQP